MSNPVITNPAEWITVKDALPVLSKSLGFHVSRPTVTTWLKAGFLPGVWLDGGRAVLIPRAALPLFRKPGAGRYARAGNLARGIGISLQVLGTCTVAEKDGVMGAICPRCGKPWVIRAHRPTVSGHEADLACCSLDCLYTGADFISRQDHRVTFGDHRYLYVAEAPGSPAGTGAQV